MDGSSFQTQDSACRVVEAQVGRVQADMFKAERTGSSVLKRLVSGKLKPKTRRNIPDIFGLWAVETTIKH